MFNYGDKVLFKNKKMLSNKGLIFDVIGKRYDGVYLIFCDQYNHDIYCAGGYEGLDMIFGEYNHTKGQLWACEEDIKKYSLYNNNSVLFSG